MIVNPRASVTAIDRIEAAAVRVRVAAPPVDGAANAALLRFLADALGVSRSTVAIVSGENARRKRVAFAHLSPDHLLERIEKLITTEHHPGRS